MFESSILHSSTKFSLLLKNEEKVLNSFLFILQLSKIIFFSKFQPKNKDWYVFVVLINKLALLLWLVVGTVGAKLSTKSYYKVFNKKFLIKPVNIDRLYFCLNNNLIWSSFQFFYSSFNFIPPFPLNISKFHSFSILHQF